MSGSGVGPRVDLRPRSQAALSPPVGDHPQFCRRYRLLGLTLVVAAACLAVALLVDRADPAGGPGARFWLAALVIVGAQLARVRLRVGGGHLFLGLGEAGVIAALCLVPPAWMPLAAALGLTVTHIDRVVTAAGPRIRVPYAICALTIASSTAAATVALLTGRPTDQLRPDTLAALAVLVVAAFAYSAVATLFGAAWLLDGRGIGPAFQDVVHSRRFILPANIALGLAVAIVLDTDPRWLVALAPIAVILHRVYLSQARIDDGSRWWENLAAATRGLSHTETGDVAAAALRGAATLFGAAEVQIGLPATEGGCAEQTWVWYGRETAGQVTVGVAPLVGTEVVARPLAVGETVLGEIRFRLGRGRLDRAAEPVLATFVFAVANALSDAATHRDLEALAARSAFDAVHDPLTGLPNRSMLVALGDAELARRPHGCAAALVLLDVDAFRAVNDTLSPAAGDDLLKVIAGRLREATREGEILARLGGDEFALLLGRDAGSVEAAHERAMEISALVASPVALAGVRIGVTATIGVGLGRAGSTASPLDGVDTDELMRRAGAALQRARRTGVALARHGELQPPGAARCDRHSVLADLRDALANTTQLGVLLQPVVDLATVRPVGAEALVRWRHPTRGVLLPADFLDVVERSELAGGFTRHVIDMALRVVAEWSRLGIDLPVTANLCARCTLDPQLPVMVSDRLSAHGVTPDRLILEITEAVMVADRALVKRAVAAVRELGVQVSVGDFGTASASLDLLTRCRVDEVKIDRTFVAAMTTSPETAAIVAATVDLARALDIRVVAEAVELPEQRQALVALGVEYAQGHLFHPPLPANDMTELLVQAA